MKNVSVIASPKQNQNGSILISNTEFKNEENITIYSKKFLQIFVHFCKINDGIIQKCFIPINEHFIFEHTNSAISDKIKTQNIPHAFTSVSTLKMSISDEETKKFITEYEINDKNIIKFISKNQKGNISKKQLKSLKKYFEEVKEDIDVYGVDGSKIFKNYHVYSLIHRIGLILSINYDEIEKEILDISISDPMLITGHDITKWKRMDWGQKKVYNKTFSKPFNGIPVFKNEIWEPKAVNQ